MAISVAHCEPALKTEFIELCNVEEDKGRHSNIKINLADRESN